MKSLVIKLETQNSTTKQQGGQFTIINNTNKYAKRAKLLLFISFLVLFQ